MAKKKKPIKNKARNVKRQKNLTPAQKKRQERKKAARSEREIREKKKAAEAQRVRLQKAREFLASQEFSRQRKSDLIKALWDMGYKFNRDRDYYEDFLYTHRDAFDDIIRLLDAKIEAILNDERELNNFDPDEWLSDQYDDLFNSPDMSVF